MKKALKIICLLALVVALGAAAACAGKQEETQVHKIGVVVYDLQDEQVQAFREYLEGYIAENFTDVDFLYSPGVTTEEEELAFLQSAIDEGVEGFLAFNSFDLETEIKLCADNGVYFIRPSSTTATEQFEKVVDNPYFLGYFGPGDEMEYQAGYDMGSYFAEHQSGDSYFLISGGASANNVMHSERTIGVLDALQESYGVQFDQTSEELAATQEPLHVQAGDLKVCIFPGYISAAEVGQQAVAEFQADKADVVMSVIPLQTIAASLGDADLGIIDCYTAQNGELFKNGHLKYLCGKYESIIGPAFAALYNAIGGYGDQFREDGRAFAIQQGFWTSTTYADFQKKYALSSGIALNAYSYEDLLEVCKAHNPDATLDDLKALAAAWDFDSAAQRRK